MTDPTGLRQALVQWLAEHEDDEHNALPHVAAHPLVKEAFDRKLEGWADELLAGPLAPLVDFAAWIVSWDDDYPSSPGRVDRQTVTLTRIVERARRALDAS